MYLLLLLLLLPPLPLLCEVGNKGDRGFIKGLFWIVLSLLCESGNNEPRDSYLYVFHSNGGVGSTTEDIILIDGMLILPTFAKTTPQDPKKGLV